MNKQDNPVILILAITLTVGLISGILWFVNQKAPGLLSDSNGATNTSNRANGQLKLLGDTFSGYSTFRNTEFQESLQENGIRLSYKDEFNQAERANQLNQGKALREDQRTVVR